MITAVIVLASLVPITLQCEYGILVNNVCRCDLHWTGTKCDTRECQLHDDCKSSDEDCAGAKRGPNCTVPCNRFTYGKNCRRYAGCYEPNTLYVTSTGQCVCKPQHFGHKCERSCECNSRGKCDANGKCKCQNSHGEFCQYGCPDFKYGSFCEKTCLKFRGPKCDHCECLNGGVCVPDMMECLCPPGYTGRLCRRKCPMGFYGQNCTSRCITKQPHIDYCDHIEGMVPNVCTKCNMNGTLFCTPNNRCICKQHHQGDDCSIFTMTVEVSYHHMEQPYYEDDNDAYDDNTDSTTTTLGTLSSETASPTAIASSSSIVVLETASPTIIVQNDNTNSSSSLAALWKKSKKQAVIITSVVIAIVLAIVVFTIFHIHRRGTINRKRLSNYSASYVTANPPSVDFYGSNDTFTTVVPEQEDLIKKEKETNIYETPNNSGNIYEEPLQQQQQHNYKNVQYMDMKPQQQQHNYINIHQPQQQHNYKNVHYMDTNQQQQQQQQQNYKNVHYMDMNKGTDRMKMLLNELVSRRETDEAGYVTATTPHYKTPTPHYKVPNNIALYENLK